MAKKTRTADYKPPISNLLDLEPSKAQKQQIQIVETAISELAKNGFAALSYTALAKACDVSRPLIHHYFPSINDLLLMSARYARATLLGLAQEGLDKNAGDESEQLRGYIEGCFKWVLIFPDQAKFWMLYFYHSAVDEVAFDANSQLVDAGHARITKLLNSGKKSGLFKFADASETAKTIQLLISGSVVACVTEKSVVTPKTAGALVFRQSQILTGAK